VRHGSPGLQLELGVHEMQLPLLQNRLLPHEVPLGTFPPASMQTGLPLAQVRRPVWQPIGRRTRHPVAAGLTIPIAADATGATTGAVALVAVLQAAGGARLARRAAGLARVAWAAGDVGRARDAGSVAADLIVAAFGPISDVGPGVHAHRAAARAGQTADVTLVGRRAGHAVTAGFARSVPADATVAASLPIGLVAAGHALRRSGACIRSCPFCTPRRVGDPAAAQIHLRGLRRARAHEPDCPAVTPSQLSRTCGFSSLVLRPPVAPETASTGSPLRLRSSRSCAGGPALGHQCPHAGVRAGNP
jgi:hypothetical protein